MPKFTPIEQRIVDLLSDNLGHTREEIFGCLNDDLGSLSNIRAHLSNLRKKIRPLGQDVRCEYLGGKTYYRWVRLMASPYDGKY